MQESRQQHKPEPAPNRQLVPVPDLPTTTQQAPIDFYGIDHPEPLNREPDLAQSLRQHIRLVTKHAWLYVVICALSLIGASAYLAASIPLYSATTRIQIDRASQKILRQDTTAALTTSASDYLRTQYALLASRSMAEHVATGLRLAHESEFLAPRNADWLGVFNQISSNKPAVERPSLSQRQSTAVSIIYSHVEIRPLPGSRLVDIRYKDPSAAQAQRIADAYADAYIKANIEGRLASSNYAKQFLSEQIEQQRARLEASERKLLLFARLEKIVATGERTFSAEESLSAANKTLGQLISERIKNQQLWQQIKNAASIELPQFLSNAAIDQLRTRLKALKNEYQEKLETFKPDYPAMRRIKSKIDEANRQLAAEAKAIRASFEAAYRNAVNQEKEMRAQIEELRAEVLDLKNKQIRYDILKREVDSNRALHNSLLKRFKEVDVSGSVRATNIFVVDRAQLPSAPSEPRRSRTLILAFLLGLGASTLIAYTIELLDDRIHTPEDAEQITGQTTIGIIPREKNQAPRARSRNALTKSATSQAYRSLATALQFSTYSGLPRSLAITSSGFAEGKSATTHALARHFATIGFKVLLIDGDLQNPTLHSLLHLQNTSGLSCYLVGALEPSDIIQHTDLANLSFIASGPSRPNASDHLAGNQLQRLIAAGLEVFDLVLVDGPPVATSSDAIYLSNATSASLFAIACGKRRKRDIQHAIRLLRLSGTPLVGTVLTNSNDRR